MFKPNQTYFPFGILRVGRATLDDCPKEKTLNLLFTMDENDLSVFEIKDPT